MVKLLVKLVVILVAIDVEQVVVLVAIYQTLQTNQSQS